MPPTLVVEAYGVLIVPEPSPPSTRRGLALWQTAGIVLGTLSVLALALLVLGTGNKEVSFDFDNQTDFLICYHATPDVSADCNKIEAERTKRWSPGCGAEQSLFVTLTLAEGGLKIYGGTQTCSGWNVTDRRFIIEQVGDEFVVTDPFGDVTRTIKGR
jgi:hypothetical protein